MPHPVYETVVGTDVAEAVRLLKSGEIVALPTETVYGLAGNALDATAVARIFEAKERPAYNPLILHTQSPESAFKYAQNIPAAARLLAAHFWPGPLTLLLSRTAAVPDAVTAGSARVALRVPAHKLFRAVLEELDFPLAAPSANRFKAVSPTTAAHVQQSLQGRIPYILDGGACTVGLESTILGFEGEMPVLYRNGGIPAEALEAVLGVKLQMKTAAGQHPVAPGQLAQHYAPATPLLLGNIEELLAQHTGKKIAVISFATPYPAAYFNIVLSPGGDDAEAARQLFGALRYADAAGSDLIVAEWAPQSGLGAAINDRLCRAATTA
jgi:L-threonylcarbamoyladenylate synthase